MAENKGKIDEVQTSLGDPSKPDQPITAEISDIPNTSSANGKKKIKKIKPSLQGKIFNDPIHGHIEIHPLCVKIIDTPQFQRLRSIKQLGGTYFVYPGASHNRFEHSIGVCHLAGQFVSALSARQPELDIDDDDVLCVQIAGLCHDLGHGPFSHMFDKRFLPRFGIKTKHEFLSVQMFKHLIVENEIEAEFEKYIDGDLEKFKTFIFELIEGASKNEAEGWPYEGTCQEKRFLYEIVANKRNGIDVDKWDYFARDCHMLGIKNSFDHTRCMKFARVVEVNGEKQICFRDKEVENLYEMFHTRDVLHRRAYQHNVGNIIEIMISEAMEKANEHILTPGKNGVKFRISDTFKDMSAYENLTDSIVDRIVWSEDRNLDDSKKILKKVKSRMLYKCLGYTLPPNKMSETEVLQRYVNILETMGSGLCKNDVTIDIVNLNYGKKDENPIDHVCFYKKNDPDKAEKRKKSEVSGLLPTKFDEQQIRFYCKKNDPKSLTEAFTALQDWCKENKCSVINGISITPVKSTDQGNAGGCQSTDQ